jgi:NADPH:quinone reductase-like Zn-dependent oxidoreductase
VKASVVTAYGSPEVMRYQVMPDPELGSGEVLVQVVVAIGNRVTNLKPGQRVCGWSYHTYAELVADKAELFAVVPEAMDLVDAAAIPLAGVTAVS